MKLPRGKQVSVYNEGVFQLQDIYLNMEDLAELTRLYLTVVPLGINDVRLRLLEEIRGAIVKSEKMTGMRWLVLNALRAVSLRKIRSRQRQST